MRTGRVSVPGAAMNTVIVTSSNELMKASAQPLARPGTISGRVTRFSTVHSDAPSETAACSIARSRPTAEASVRRSAKGSTITMCDSTRPVKVPPSPIWVKKRRKAMPSTMCGIISGDMNSAVIASRPRKR